MPERNKFNIDIAFLGLLILVAPSMAASDEGNIELVCETRVELVVRDSVQTVGTVIRATYKNNSGGDISAIDVTLLNDSDNPLYSFTEKFRSPVAPGSVELITKQATYAEFPLDSNVWERVYLDEKVKFEGVNSCILVEEK